MSLNDAAALLGYKPKSLSYVIYKMATKYETFTVPKRSGGFRNISAPCPELKLLQRRLSDGLQSCCDEIDCKNNIKKRLSHGFRRGLSIVSNASVHRGKRFVFNVDIEDFFGSINFGRVYGFFMKNKDFALKESVAKVLATIACHEGKLPQGSPCSPVISDLIGQILDVRLNQLARKHGCSYSRYADDLTFSTNEKTFPSAIALSRADHSWVAGTSLSKTIEKSGFKLNVKKTRMQYHDSRQEVTGLIVNRRINTRPEYRRLARAMTHSLLTTGEFHVTEIKIDASGKRTWTNAKGNIQHLQGLFGFIDWIDLSHKKARKTLDGEPSSIDRTYKQFLMHRDFWASTLPVILCEGKTDSIYLRGAIRNLAAFHPDLVSVNADGSVQYKVRFFNYSYTSQRILDLSGGTPAILNFIKSYIKSFKSIHPPRNQKPLIIFLDNDSGGKEFRSLIKQYSGIKTTVLGMEDFYHIVSNVYIVFTPIDKPGDSSMIEDFFEPSLLETTIDGKSFNPDDKTIDITKEYGKSVFSAKVVRPNIGTIDFNKFNPILGRITSAIRSHNKKIH